MKDGTCIDAESTEADWKTIIDQLSYYDKNSKEVFIGYAIQNYAIYLTEIDCLKKSNNIVIISFDGMQKDLELKCDDSSKVFNDLILFYNKNLNTNLER